MIFFSMLGGGERIENPIKCQMIDFCTVLRIHSADKWAKGQNSSQRRRNIGEGYPAVLKTYKLT